MSGALVFCPICVSAFSLEVVVFQANARSGLALPTQICFGSSGATAPGDAAELPLAVCARL